MCCVGLGVGEPFENCLLALPLHAAASAVPPPASGSWMLRVHNSFIFLLEAHLILVVALLQEVALMNDWDRFLFQRNPGLMWAFCGHHCISILL